MDQSKKTMRHFYCRDVLWETFEQMANDFDCSIDYLINEAMRYYARSKNYQAAAGAANASQESIPARPPSLPESSHPPMGAASPTPSLRRTTAPPPPPSLGGDGAIGAAPSPIRRPASVPPGAMPVARRSSPPVARAVPEPAPAVGPTLYLIFNNQRISIDKDQFIIGRSS